MNQQEKAVIQFKYKQIEKPEMFTCPFCERLLQGKRYIVQLNSGECRECCTDCTESIIKLLEV